MSNYTHAVSKTSLSAVMLKAQSSSSSTQSASGVKPIPMYEAFKAPSVPDSKNVKAAIELYLTLPGVTRSNSIASVTAQRGLAVLPDVARAVVQNPRSAMTTGGADRTAVSVLRNEQFGSPISREFRANMIKEANLYYLGQGTPFGMATRMKSQLQSRKPTAPTQEDLDAIIALLPKKTTAQLPADITLLAADPEFNAKAHPGAPFYITGITAADPSVLAQSVALATRYFSVLTDDPEGATALVKLSVSEAEKHNFITMLSAKMDVMERDSYFKKTRPIGITPFWLRLLESVLTQSYYPAMANFEDDPTSISAFRFSWLNGGIQRLADFILTPHDGAFHALSWGDDQIWMCRAQDGSVFLLFPDVSGMDMKITSRHYRLYRGWLVHLFTDEKVSLSMFEEEGGLEDYLEKAKIGANWLELLLFHVASAAKKQVMVDNGVVINMNVGLLSGKSATTIIDFIGSADLINQVKRVPMPRTGSPSDIADYQKRVMKAADAAGFPLKADTMAAQRLDEHDLVHLDGSVTPLPNSTVIGLPFLGMKIVQFTYRGDYTVSGEDLVVLAPESDAVNSVMKTIYSTTSEDTSKMAACFSRGYTTFTNQDAFNFQRNLFNQRIKMGMAAVANGIFNDPVLGEIELQEIENLREYPPPEYYAWLFLSEEQRALVRRPTLDNALDIALGVPGAPSAPEEDGSDDMAVVRRAAPKPKEEESLATVKRATKPPMLRNVITPQQRRTVEETHDDRAEVARHPTLTYTDVPTARPGMMPSDTVLREEAQARYLRLAAVRERIRQQRLRPSGQNPRNSRFLDLLSTYAEMQDLQEEKSIEAYEQSIHDVEAEWYRAHFEEADQYSDDGSPPPPPDDDVEMEDAEMDSMITPGYARNTLG